MAYTKTNVKEEIPHNPIDKKSAPEIWRTLFQLFATIVILQALLLCNTYRHQLQFVRYRNQVLV